MKYEFRDGTVLDVSYDGEIRIDEYELKEGEHWVSTKKESENDTVHHFLVNGSGEIVKGLGGWRPQVDELTQKAYDVINKSHFKVEACQNLPKGAIITYKGNKYTKNSNGWCDKNGNTPNDHMGGYYRWWEDVQIEAMPMEYSEYESKFLSNRYDWQDDVRRYPSGTILKVGNNTYIKASEYGYEQVTGDDGLYSLKGQQTVQVYFPKTQWKIPKYKDDLPLASIHADSPLTKSFQDSKNNEKAMQEILEKAESGSIITDGVTWIKAGDDWITPKIGYDTPPKSRLIHTAMESQSELGKLAIDIPKVEVDANAKTLTNYSRKLSNHLAQLVLDKRNGVTAGEAKTIISKMQTMLDNAAFSTRIDSNAIDSLLSKGLKNQFETKTSGGTNNPKQRREASTEMFGTPKGVLGKKLEKYGYLGSKSFIEDVKAQGDSKISFLGQYGDVIVHFKKDNLKTRTTYTVDDSLGLGVVPGMATTATLAGIDYDGRYNANTNQGLVLKQLYEGLNKADLTNPQDLANKTEGIVYNSMRYIEAQYHGDVTPNDIEEICFTQTTPSEKTVELAKSKGIKVYQIIEGKQVEL